MNSTSNNKFDISNDDPKAKKHILSSPSISKPTVIRPSIPILEPKSGLLSCFKNDDDSIDGSPPMPSMPPPPPPPEALEVLAHGPPLPPRPTKSYVSTCSTNVLFHEFLLKMQFVEEITKNQP